MCHVRMFALMQEQPKHAIEFKLDKSKGNNHGRKVIISYILSDLKTHSVSSVTDDDI